MKHRILILFLSLFFIVNIASCDSKDSSYAFKYAITGNPKTLDPQRALCDSSDAIITAVFQGLFSFGDNGEISNGMIESFAVSDDGTIWTFKLKNGIYWSDGNEFSAECTAEDYVFAFQRLFKPETKSERADEYYIIKNAEAINNGIISDITQLGVTAKDKYTLEITLEKPCSDFKALLALAPAMPCNEEYYNSTQGRYGLAADCLASNSGYYVHTWSYDKWSNEGNYIILRRNNSNAYSENSPYTINLFINPQNERKDFDEEVLKVYKGKSEDEIDDLKFFYEYSEYETGVWGLIFNVDNCFSNQNHRLELASATDFSVSDERYTLFNGIIPYSVKIGNNTYRELAGNCNSPVGIDSSVGAVSGARLIIPQGTGLRGDMGKVLQNWQSECGFYCSIAELEETDYQKALQNGDFEIALVKLSGEYNSPYAYLNDFLNNNSANYSGYSSQKFSHIISSALTSVDDSSAAVYYKEAEQLLIDSGVFVPLCIETEYIFYKDNFEAITYNPFSGVYSVKK